MIQVWPAICRKCLLPAPLAILFAGGGPVAGAAFSEFGLAGGGAVRNSHADFVPVDGTTGEPKILLHHGGSGRSRSSFALIGD